MKQSDYITKTTDTDRAARILINSLKRSGLSTFNIYVDWEAGDLTVSVKRADILAEANPVNEHMTFVDTGDGEQVTLASKTKDGLQALKARVIKMKQGEEEVEL